MSMSKSFHLNLQEDQQRKLKEIPKLKVDFKMLSGLTPMGSGGCGTVYKAQHQQWGRVAFKKLDGKSPNKSDPLLKELEKLKELRHPNIIQVMGYVWERENYGLLLPFYEYGSLEMFIEAWHPISEYSKTKFCEEIATAMNYLHTQNPGIIHRDLKIANVLVTDACNMMLTDFGISAWRTTQTRMTRNVTGSGGGSGGGGTVTHIAPEMWRNINYKPRRSYDVYAMGILMWEIYTEVEPYEGVTVDQIRYAVLDKQRPDVELFEEKCPEMFPKIRELVEKCWSQEPDDRPTFQVIMETLRELCDSHKDEIDQSHKALKQRLHQPRDAPPSAPIPDSGVHTQSPDAPGGHQYERQAGVGGSLDPPPSLTASAVFQGTASPLYSPQVAAAPRQGPGPSSGPARVMGGPSDGQFTAPSQPNDPLCSAPPNFEDIKTPTQRVHSDGRRVLCMLQRNPIEDFETPSPSIDRSPPSANEGQARSQDEGQARSGDTTQNQGQGQSVGDAGSGGVDLKEVYWTPSDSKETLVKEVSQATFESEETPLKKVYQTTSDTDETPLKKVYQTTSDPDNTPLKKVYQTTSDPDETPLKKVYQATSESSLSSQTYLKQRSSLEEDRQVTAPSPEGSQSLPPNPSANLNQSTERNRSTDRSKSLGPQTIKTNPSLPVQRQQTDGIVNWYDAKPQPQCEPRHEPWCESEPARGMYEGVVRDVHSRETYERLEGDGGGGGGAAGERGAGAGIRETGGAGGGAGAGLSHSISSPAMNDGVTASATHSLSQSRSTGQIHSTRVSTPTSLTPSDSNSSLDQDGPIPSSTRSHQLPSIHHGISIHGPAVHNMIPGVQVSIPGLQVTGGTVHVGTAGGHTRSRPVQIGNNNQMNIRVTGNRGNQRTTPPSGNQPSGKQSKKKQGEKPRRKLYVTDSTAPIDQRNMETMSRHLGTKWRQVGRALGLESGELDAVAYDNRDDLKETIIKMLELWRERRGPDATLKELANTLLNLRMYEIAGRLKSPGTD